MKKLAALLALSLVLLSINASAEGITPGKITINFIPNLKTTIPFIVTGYNDITVETDCQELAYNNDAEKNAEGKITFSTTLILPSRINGPKECGVKVKEASNKNAGIISAQVELISSVLINAPYPGRHIDLRLEANNANKGDPIIFKATANNLGDKKLEDAQVTLELIKDGNPATTMQTEKKDIEQESSTEFTKEFDTTPYAYGRYLAIAKLKYDDKIAMDQKDIIIGALNLEIISYPEELETGNVEPFDIAIGSLWGKEIDDVYAAVSIANKYSQETAKTKAINLMPWQQAILNANINTTSTKPGTYDIKITVFYQDKTTTKTGKILLKKPEQPKQPITQQIKNIAKNPIIISLLISLIVLADICWILKQKSKRHPKK